MSKKAMKRLTRDDTEHGVEYYRADEVDALLAEQPAQQQEPWHEEPAGHIAWGVQPAQQQMPDDWFKGMPEEYRRAAWRAIWRAAQPLPDFSPIFGNTKENT